MTREELQGLHQQAMDDLEEMGALWLEARAAGKSTDAAAVALREAEAATRKLERQMRKQAKRNRKKETT